jgi:hypothetical protein
MAAKKNAKTRRSPADIKKAWQNFQPALAEHRKEHERQGQTFKSITREEFEAKMKRANSPMILSEGWSNSAPPGGTINYSVGIGNPDPIEWFTLAVSVSIGNRNPIASNDEFLTSTHVFRLMPSRRLVDSLWRPARSRLSRFRLRFRQVSKRPATSATPHC